MTTTYWLIVWGFWCYLMLKSGVYHCLLGYLGYKDKEIFYPLLIRDVLTHPFTWGFIVGVPLWYLVY